MCRSRLGRQNSKMFRRKNRAVNFYLRQARGACLREEMGSCGGSSEEERPVSARKLRVSNILLKAKANKSLIFILFYSMVLFVAKAVRDSVDLVQRILYFLRVTCSEVAVASPVVCRWIRSGREGTDLKTTSTESKGAVDGNTQCDTAQRYLQ
jgi:hypothetical protein